MTARKPPGEETDKSTLSSSPLRLSGRCHGESAELHQAVVVLHPPAFHGKTHLYPSCLDVRGRHQPALTRTESGVADYATQYKTTCKLDELTT